MAGSKKVSGKTSKKGQAGFGRTLSLAFSLLPAIS